MPFTLAPRLKTFDYVGFNRYFLTICTINRERLFTNEADVGSVRTSLRHASDTNLFAVIAYCIMPDHLHVLTEGLEERSDFKEFVRLFKQRSAYAWKQRTGDLLWQRSYYDRVLRAHDDVFAVARYILANPVRAGLARSPGEYPFAGSFTMDVADLIGSVQSGVSIETGGSEDPLLRHRWTHRRV